MKSEKISFLKRAWLAITDFRMYPYMLKEKFGTAFGYFIKFLIVISVIIAAFTTSVLFKKMPVIQNALENKLPEFSLSNGILSSNENMQYKLDDNVFLVFEPNSNYAQSSELKLNDSNVYDFYIMAFSDTFVLGVGTDGGIVEISKKTYDPLVTMNKVDLIGMFNDFTQSSVIRATILISITLSTFIVMLIRRLTNVITFIISTYLINFLFKVKLKAVDYFKIFIYASTLPIILSVVALLAVGRISETVETINIIISSVYIFYALRAIKLDFLIFGDGKNDIKEKVRNALAHAQEELDKQLEKIETEDEEEANEQKKDLEKLSQEIKEKEEQLLKAQEEYDEAIKKAMLMKQKDEDEENEKK